MLLVHVCVKLDPLITHGYGICNLAHLLLGLGSIENFMVQDIKIFMAFKTRKHFQAAG